jgi:hypothetical protein
MIRAFRPKLIMRLHRVGGQGLARSERAQQPRPPPFGADLGSVQQVSLAHDSDDLASVVDHRNSTDSCGAAN